MNGNPTFLIIDDDVDARFINRHALEKAFPGATVLEAETADAALRTAESHPLDGVISDHQLGMIGADTFIRELRSRGVACPIVMVTASTDPSVFRRAYDAGAAHVFANDDYDFVGYFRAALSSRRSRAAK